MGVRGTRSAADAESGSRFRCAAVVVAVAAFVALLLAAPPVWASRGHGRLHHRRGRRHHIANMPVGWTWPPSPPMRSEGQRCLDELDRLGVAWTPGPRTRKITTPILVPDMELGGVKLTPVWRHPPFVMDCHLALALARDAEVFLELGVHELRFSTIYDYRRIRVRGHHPRALSRHSLGLAIDVYAMVTDDGRTLVVGHDYRRGDRTLHAIERGLASSLEFRTPLTPGNAPRSHRDHFHLEARVKYDQASEPTTASLHRGWPKTNADGMGAPSKLRVAAR